ncbi:PREDICTED: uncharacterized protein LOC102020138 [Chinchilla lanigera]|uniref:uncharacterized protein LOC102020138 n=1 Tax=Chinchilla lanigera TaxID=34839 RepID=UPI00038F0967|nr:PREDICTED: uncharacterized protein LOC102020138 [Chinchilla lanigera]
MVPTSVKNICHPVILMWKMMLFTYGFPGVKQQIYALIILLFSFVIWVFGIVLMNSLSWRVWEFDKEGILIAFIGLWKAQYYVRGGISGSAHIIVVESKISSDWTHAIELEYAKDLMVLVNFLQSAALILCTVAFIVSRLKTTYPDFLQFYYRTSAVLLLLSSGCVALAVSWNYAMDISGQSTLDFPLSFSVDKEDVIKKHLSHVFPLGMVTAALSLLNSTLCFGYMCFTKPKSVAPSDVP